jgi:hypothetical protein
VRDTPSVGSDLQRRDQMRPSDEARERAADALRSHYAAGRLDEADFESRVELAYAAATRADLKALFRDLPWDPRSRARAEAFWGFQRRMLRAHGAAYLGVNSGLVGIWAATGGGEFWPAGSLAGWGAFLGGHWAIARAVRKSRERGGRRRLPRPPRRALSR